MSSTHMDPTDMRLIIINRADLEMTVRGIPLTTENRIAFLTGMCQAWTESDGTNPDAIPWIDTINAEIAYLRSIQ